MPNLCLGARLRLTILFFLTWSVPAWGQLYNNNPYDASVTGAYNPWGLDDGMSNLPRSPQPQLPPGAPAIVSIDTLRHPLSSKGRQLLDKAKRLGFQEIWLQSWNLVRLEMNRLKHKTQKFVDGPLLTYDEAVQALDHLVDALDRSNWTPTAPAKS